MGTDELDALRAEIKQLRARVAALEAEREELAQTDAATGLPNGRAFEVLAERELHNGSRYGGLMALLVLDVAERSGTGPRAPAATGDGALALLADALRSGARRGDVAARYGESEFVLLMVQCGRSGAVTALARLNHRLAQAGVPCSAGIAVFPNDGEELRALLDAARAAARAKAP